MARYRTYFRWAGGLAIAYAAVLVISWALLSFGVGLDVYDQTQPTATRLFRIYASHAAAAAAYVAVAGRFVLLTATPAFALYLGRRTPGLAWGGLAVGAVALFVGLVGDLLEGAAYGLAAAGPGGSLLALVPSGDALLLINTLAGALAMPAQLAMYVWFILWAIAFGKAGSSLARGAAAAFFAAPAFFVLTLVAFGLGSGPAAAAATFLATVAEAGAFALGGGILLRVQS